MRHVGRIVLLTLVVAILAQPAFAGAEDKRFALRFGVMLFEPTSNSSVDGSTVELQTSWGSEVDFEWYILQRLGLEVSVASAVDGEFEGDSDDFTLDGINIAPLTLGVNAHIVRNSEVDFYIGLLGGRMRFSSFDVSGGDGNFDFSSDKIANETTFGIQAAADINIGENWGVNLGLKYLDADATLEGVQDNQGRNVTIAINPLIFRVMGVFRF